MCFSATASFLAGGTLTATGVLTIKKSSNKKEVPFASIPLIFGLQQAIEGVVWLSFGSASLHTVATYAFVFFSHVFWPVFLPIAVLCIEPRRMRRRILQVLSGIGVLLSGYLLSSMLFQSVSSTMFDHSISYHVPHSYPLIALTLYVLVTCGSCFISTHRMVNAFGAALLISFIAAGWFYAATIFSVWCFFAAVLSVLVYAHFRHPHPTRP